MAPSPSRGRARLFAAITIALGLAIGLVIAEVGLGWYRQQIERSDRLADGMMTYDPTLGWRLVPGWRGHHSHHDYEADYAINRQGFRGAVDPGRTAGASRRVGVFGDSFTFGIGVGEGETFVARLDAALAPNGAAFNFGVPGFATDQALLLAERVLGSTEARLTDVVLVVYLANDLIDNGLAFPLQAPRGKPYFELVNGALALKNTPVPLTPKPLTDAARTFAGVVLAGTPPPGALVRTLSRLEVVRWSGVPWPAPPALFPGAEERFRPSVALFDALVARLAQSTSAANARLTVALLPGRASYAPAGGVSQQYQDFVRAEAAAGLRARGLQPIDVSPRLGAAHYFRYDGHLTVEGNRVVGAALVEALR